MRTSKTTARRNKSRNLPRSGAELRTEGARARVVLTPFAHVDRLRGALAAAAPGCDVVMANGEPDVFTARRLVVIAADPYELLRDTMRSHAVPTFQALLYACRILAEASDAALASDALAFGAAELEDDQEGALARLFAHLGVADAGAATQRFRRALGPIAAAAGSPRSVETEAGIAAARDALELYRELPPKAGSRARWDPQLFRRADAPDAAGSESIDLTGRARILLFGPYIALCAGRWCAEVEIEVCAEAARRELLLQFGSGADIEETTVRPAKAGVYRIPIEHDFAGASPAEVRVVLPRAAFHGELRLLGVEVERMGMRENEQ